MAKTLGDDLREEGYKENYYFKKIGSGLDYFYEVLDIRSSSPTRTNMRIRQYNLDGSLSTFSVGGQNTSIIDSELNNHIDDPRAPENLKPKKPPTS